MDREYYNEYYQLERNHWWFITRNKIIINRIKKILDPNKQYKILNIGVATGESSRLLEEFGKVFSLEYDYECAELTKKKTDIDIINASAINLPFQDSTFDLVCAFDVIEHIEDDNRAINEITRVCTQNGHVVITAPALNLLWGDHDIVNQHYRRYTITRIKNLFSNNIKNQFVYCSYFNTLLFPLIFLFRSISRLIPKSFFNRKGAGSDFSAIDNKEINNIFLNIFTFEKNLLEYIRFPIGCSILLIQKKINEML